MVRKYWAPGFSAHFFITQMFWKKNLLNNNLKSVFTTPTESWKHETFLSGRGFSSNKPLKAHKQSYSHWPMINCFFLLFLFFFFIIIFGSTSHRKSTDLFDRRSLFLIQHLAIILKNWLMSFVCQCSANAKKHQQAHYFEHARPAGAFLLSH